MKSTWMQACSLTTTLLVFAGAGVELRAQAPVINPPAEVAPKTQMELLEAQLAAQDRRIRLLESEIAKMLGTSGSSPGSAAAVTEPAADALATAAPSALAQPASAAIAEATPAQEPIPEPAEHEHSMSMPGGGPVLKISGFADLNLGFGSDANPLIFPLVPIGTKAATSFAIGEFDIVFSSKLSRKISFMSEIVIGPDQTNYWGLDIERMQVTLKQNRYFALSGGRYHTSIGFYNTAFHHGTWFQTATGRPFMYFFEDSGGILPVHQIGVSATGLVPHSGGLDLHWTAEVGNGRSSDNIGEPVQNFLSDKNHKAFNLAAFAKPQWLPGLQVGGSYYNDRMVPAGAPHVNQNIGSAYAVFNNSNWESLNEVVLLSDRADGAAKSLNSPLMYTQLSRKFGVYRPYFRFQYLNVASQDPVSVYTGRYEGPSVGLRADFTGYVTLKAQYNRLYQRAVPVANGLDLQMAFAF